MCLFKAFGWQTVSLPVSCIGKGKSNLLRPPFSVYSGPLFRFTPAPFSVYSGPLFRFTPAPFLIYSGHLFSQSQAKTHPRKVYSGKSGFTPGHFRVYSGLFSGTFSGLLRDIFGFTPGHFRIYCRTCFAPVLFCLRPHLH